MSDLAGLRERVAKATGPDRELDVVVGLTFGLPDDPAKYLDGGAAVRAFVAAHPAKANCADHHGFPRLTASIDAALALAERVLPGWSWGTSKIQPKPVCGALLYEPLDEPNDPALGLPAWKRKVSADAATPPLAILAALLQALEQTP